jgi:hypothetical protein
MYVTGQITRLSREEFLQDETAKRAIGRRGWTVGEPS